MRLEGRLAGLSGRLFLLGVASLVIMLFSAGSAAAVSFSDVKPGDDYSEAIQELSDQGIITGFDNGTFRPNDPVSRQQFAKMVVLTLGLQVTGNEQCPFGDVENQAGNDPFYPSKYVAVCAANGITTGKTANTFDPYSPISRAQIMSMVVRAASQFGVSLTQPTSAYFQDPRYVLRSFRDPPHADNAHIAELSGLLWGIRPDSAGVWNPYKNATRGEVAQILWRLLQKLPPGPENQPLFADDFSNPNSGWPESTSSYSSAGYSTDAGGTYKIHVMTPNWIRLATAPQGPFDTAYLETWAYPEQGLQTGWEYGLVFRVQDIDNLYELSVDSNNQAQLWKEVGGEWTQMSAPVSLPAPKNPNNPWRYLAVSMIADSFAAYVDDTYVGEFTDDTFAQGYVGFYASTLQDTPDFSTWFDDFKVWPVVY